jgi:hypothetical protein
MKLTESELRRLIREAIEMRQQASPLRYDRARDVQRLSLVEVDPSSPLLNAPPSDRYFTVTKKFLTHGPSGRRLKEPKQVIDDESPAAGVGTLAFLDYHVLDGGHVYIDFVKTRRDLMGQGHASRLAEELISINGTDKTYYFGKVINPGMWKIKEKFDSKGIKTVGWRDF